MAQEKVKFYFTFFFAIRGDESRTFSTSNVSEKIVSDNFYDFNDSIMEHQLLSDDMVVFYRKYIKWNIYLTYNLLSNELLDKIYDNIPYNILLHNINYKNKILIYNGEGESKIKFYFLLHY